MRVDRMSFLADVKQFIQDDPEALPLLINALTQGLGAALAVSQERAADMEIVASVLLERRFKNRDQLIKSKLEKWRDKCSLRWDWYLEDKP